MLYLLASLMIGEGIITEAIIARGYGSELNAVADFLITYSLLLPAKIAGAGIIIYFIQRWMKSKPKVARFVLIATVLLYAAIFAWNATIFYTWRML